MFSPPFCCLPLLSCLLQIYFGTVVAINREKGHITPEQPLLRHFNTFNMYVEPHQITKNSTLAEAFVEFHFDYVPCSKDKELRDQSCRIAEDDFSFNCAACSVLLVNLPCFDIYSKKRNYLIKLQRLERDMSLPVPV